MEHDDPITHRSFTVTCHTHRITTTVTANPTIIHDWISNTRSTYNHHIRRGRLVVGLGVQWQPTYNRRGTGRPATLQLCVGRNCLIIQLRHSPSVPDSLRRFLSDPSISFVGVGNHNDNPMLQSSRHNLSVSRLIEIRDVAAARRPGLPREISMERLAASVLGITGVNLKPGWIGASDWEAYWLNDDQIAYATIDGFISFLLGKILEVWDWERNSEATNMDRNLIDLKPDDEMFSELSEKFFQFWLNEVKTSKVLDNEKLVRVGIGKDDVQEPIMHDDYDPKTFDNMVPTVFTEEEEIISDPIKLVRHSSSPLKNWSATRMPRSPFVPS